MSNQPTQYSDEELRQFFATTFYDENYEFMVESDGFFDVCAIDKAVKFIKAYGDRRELEGRVDELNVAVDEESGISGFYVEERRAELEKAKESK